MTRKSSKSKKTSTSSITPTTPSEATASSTPASTTKKVVDMTRQNFHKESEAALNDQINLCLKAGYVYESMAWYFFREDVALKGFYKFFKKSAKIARVWSDKMVRYMEKRGGKVDLKTLPNLGVTVWGSCLEAMQCALKLEMGLTDRLYFLCNVAESKGDSHLRHHIEDVYLDEQIDFNRELGCHITQLKRVGPGVGEYLYDFDLRNKSLPPIFFLDPGEYELDIQVVEKLEKCS
jgi:ferritin heavy chain